MANDDEKRRKLIDAENREIELAERHRKERGDQLNAERDAAGGRIATGVAYGVGVAPAAIDGAHRAYDFFRTIVDPFVPQLTSHHLAEIGRAHV